MDFGIYPPEINSGRMYAGPGAGPMLAAARAWDVLAEELYTAAASYQSVVAGLTAGPWSGPSSASMAAAAASYVTWLGATAAQAEQTAAQANAAVAAYEAAFAMTVPPPVIAANRTLLMTLVATNFFGQNTPAIAATEAQYAEMWAQDAAAMYGYAGSSASASALTPFRPPRQNTDPGGAAAQAVAVGRAAGTHAGNVQSTVSTVPQVFSAAPAAAADPADPLGTLSDLITVFLTGPANATFLFGVLPLDTLSGPVSLPIDYVGTVAGLHTDDDVSGWAGVEPWPGTAQVPPQEFPAIITNPGPIATSARAMSASLGQANAVGALSVPPTWTIEAPALRPVALISPLPETPTAAAAMADTVKFGSSTSQMGLAAMMGPAMGNTLGADTGREGRGDQTTTGQRATACSATNAGNGSAGQRNSRTVVTGIAARIRQLARLRDEGRLSDEEFTRQKDRLLGR